MMKDIKNCLDICRTCKELIPDEENVCIVCFHKTHSNCGKGEGGDTKFILCYSCVSQENQEAQKPWFVLSGNKKYLLNKIKL